MDRWKRIVVTVGIRFLLILGRELAGCRLLIPFTNEMENKLVGSVIISIVKIDYKNEL